MNLIKVWCGGGPSSKPCTCEASVIILATRIDGGDEYLCWRHVASVLREALKAARTVRVRNL
jgi:hypothetical protein